MASAAVAVSVRLYWAISLYWASVNFRMLCRPVLFPPLSYYIRLVLYQCAPCGDIVLGALLDCLLHWPSARKAFCVGRRARPNEGLGRSCSNYTSTVPSKISCFVLVATNRARHSNHSHCHRVSWCRLSVSEKAGRPWRASMELRYRAHALLAGTVPLILRSQVAMPQQGISQEARRALQPALVVTQQTGYATFLISLVPSRQPLNLPKVC